MKLTVKNLGPITKGGTIDLDKRFYVFVGKNGSGKTYLANLLYDFWRGYDIYFSNSITDIDVFPFFTSEKKSVQIEKNDLVRFVENFFNKKHINTSTITDKTELYPTLSYENDFLLKKINIPILIHSNNPDVGAKKVYCFLKESNSNVIFLEEKNHVSVENTIFSLIVDYGQKEISFEDINDLFWHTAFPSWLGKTTSNIFLLPVDRLSFLSLWRYITIVERTEKDLLYNKHSNQILLTKEELKNFQPLYANPTKDLISRLERFDLTSSKETSTYKDLVLELEDLMGGKINVKEGKEGIGRKRFVFEMKENGEEIELFLASSSVNQLSILYLYLKYLANPVKNFLIIDEPEISLHPENQIKLLNILMKFADMNGNRVLITTHSPLMADAVNNHVRIEYLQEKGEDKVKWLKEHDLDFLETISHKDFGVYYFNGDSIEEYPVGDYGVAFKDFATTIQKVDKLADELKDEIYSSLH